MNLSELNQPGCKALFLFYCHLNVRYHADWLRWDIRTAEKHLQSGNDDQYVVDRAVRVVKSFQQIFLGDDCFRDGDVFQEVGKTLLRWPPSFYERKYLEVTEAAALTATLRFMRPEMVFAEDVSYYVATYANKDCALLTLPGDLFPSACQKLLEERLPEDLANLSIEIHRLWKQGITKSSDAMISGHLLILSEIRSYLDSIIPAKSVGE